MRLHASGSVKGAIRAVKQAGALLAVAGIGLGLRWATAGSAASVSADDLESLAEVTVAAVAWVAYTWLVVAVLATALEQVPGAIGRAAATIAGRITSQTSRALLRSALGVAAVTPLTVGIAHATPTTHSQDRPWAAVEPPSTVQLDNRPADNRPADGRRSVEWRATEPGSTVRLTDAPKGPSVDSTWRATEPGSTVSLTRPARAADPSAADPSADGRPAPGRTVQRASAGLTHEATDQQAAKAQDTTGRPPRRVSSPQLPLPDRPTTGAPTRYTNLRSGQPVHVPRTVTVRPGDSLWSITAAELGPTATRKAIAARWPDWYAANRDLIGPDPGLIQPGQTLRVPTQPTSPSHQEN